MNKYNRISYKLYYTLIESFLSKQNLNNLLEGAAFRLELLHTLL